MGHAIQLSNLVGLGTVRASLLHHCSPSCSNVRVIQRALATMSRLNPVQADDRSSLAGQLPGSRFNGDNEVAPSHVQLMAATPPRNGGALPDVELPQRLLNLIFSCGWKVSSGKPSARLLLNCSSGRALALRNMSRGPSPLLPHCAAADGEGVRLSSVQPQDWQWQSATHLDALDRFLRDGPHCLASDVRHAAVRGHPLERTFEQYLRSQS